LLPSHRNESIFYSLFFLRETFSSLSVFVGSPIPNQQEPHVDYTLQLSARVRGFPIPSLPKFRVPNSIALNGSPLLWRSAGCSVFKTPFSEPPPPRDRNVPHRDFFFFFLISQEPPNRFHRAPFLPGPKLFSTFPLSRSIAPLTQVRDERKRTNLLWRF